MLIKDHAIPCVPCHLHTLHMQLTLSEITWRITAERKKNTHIFTCSTIFQAITMVMIIFYVEWCGPQFSFAIMANSRTISLALSFCVPLCRSIRIWSTLDVIAAIRVCYSIFQQTLSVFVTKHLIYFVDFLFVVCVCLSFFVLSVFSLKPTLIIIMWQ